MSTLKVEMPPPSILISHLIAVFAMVLPVASLAPDRQEHEYCQFETFNATCGQNEVILMQTARYGRMKEGRCISSDHDPNCVADVLPQMDKECSGKRVCQVSIPNQDLHETLPCKEMMAYLEATYKCVKVDDTSTHDCHEPKTTKTGGYLASVSTLESAAGTPECPWIIQVPSGQRINLTLLNFGPTDPEASCGVYVNVHDGSGQTMVPICKGIKRERSIYSSSYNKITVFIQTNNIGVDSRFIIKYSPVGCSDLDPIENAVIRREGDTTTVKCNYTGDTFFLTCTDHNTWYGEIHNCTKDQASGTSRNVANASKFPYGLLIVIGIGVALGVALGIIMLAGILMCLRKNKDHDKMRYTSDPLLSEATHDTEDTQSTYYTRSECGHGLATLSRQAWRNQGIYSDGTVKHAGAIPVPVPSPCVMYREVHAHAHVPLDDGPGDNERMCSCGKPVSEHDENEMQTSFITFKPDSIQDTIVRHENAMNAHASVDLVRDSEPYRQLKPNALVLECTCTLRPGQMGCHSPRTNTGKRDTQSSNKSV